METEILTKQETRIFPDVHQDGHVVIKRMWQGGPLRQFASKAFKGSIPVVGGHAGAYVCDIYDHITPAEGEEGGIKLHRGEGLMEDKWLCLSCGERFERDKVSKKRKVARQNKASSASQDAHSSVQPVENQPNSMIFGALAVS